MRHLFISLSALALAAGAHAAWYWPFSSDDEQPPRVSELMEPASVMIDEAFDLAADGKTAEAVAKYRAALVELDRIKAENPDRVKSPEFNTLKNKRATVTAAIDSLLLEEAEANAKAIAVTDTTELERKYAAKKGRSEETPAEAKKPEVQDPEPQRQEVAGKPTAEKPAEKAERKSDAPGKPKSRFARALDDLRRKDYAAVDLTVSEILNERPSDAAALNLKAAVELARGDAKAAEKTLDRAIMSNPRSYFAYYNMARLMVRAKDNKAGARRYYDTGRKLGGPVDPVLEDLLK